MYKFASIIATIGFLILPPLVGQAPDTVALADLTIAALPHGTDTAAVRRLLGPPLQVIRHTQRNDDGALLVDWRYPGLLLSFAAGALYTADVSSRKYRTLRGVQVGDSVAVVARHYGKPLYGGTTASVYAISSSDFEHLGIEFVYENGLITRIITGEVISVE